MLKIASSVPTIRQLFSVYSFRHHVEYLNIGNGYGHVRRGCKASSPNSPKPSMKQHWRH